MTELQKPQYFLLIDAHALIYRAYHAFPPLSTKSGQLVNAVYGFSRHILTAIRDFQPEYIAVTFDRKPTNRLHEFADYKAHRPPMPDDLRSQIPIVKEVVKTLNMPQFEVEGFEADDLIGTLTAHIGDCEAENLMTVIVTGDRDAFQLVNDCVHVWLPGRGKGQTDMEYDRAAVKTKMGVFPEQIVDLKALMGDASDNIPGVKGVGEKTAIHLIQEFETLQKVYEAVDVYAEKPAANLKATLVAKLQADRESAFLSQKLAQIDRQAPITFDLSACRVAQYDKEKAQAMFEEMDFKSLINLLPADDFELALQGALF